MKSIEIVSHKPGITKMSGKRIPHANAIRYSHVCLWCNRGPPIVPLFYSLCPFVIGLYCCLFVISPWFTPSFGQNHMSARHACFDVHSYVGLCIKSYSIIRTYVIYWHCKYQNQTSHRRYTTIKQAKKDETRLKKIHVYYWNKVTVHHLKLCYFLMKKIIQWFVVFC